MLMKSFEEFVAEQQAKEEALAQAAKEREFLPAEDSQLTALANRFAKPKVKHTVTTTEPKTGRNGYGRKRTAEELAAVIIPDFRPEPKDRVWASGKKSKKNSKKNS